MSYLQEIEREATSWPNVTTHEHRFGGREFRFGNREIGHYHEPQDLLDVPFPKRVRDELIEAGLAEKHHVLPESGWISFRVRDPGDINQATDLLKRSYELAETQAERRKEREKVG